MTLAFGWDNLKLVALIVILILIAIAFSEDNNHKRRW